jgi:hypothetical protein
MPQIPNNVLEDEGPASEPKWCLTDVAKLGPNASHSEQIINLSERLCPQVV